MILEQEVTDIAAYVAKHGLTDEVLSQVRENYAGKHFTWCTEDDINSGKPIFEHELFDVYAVNSSDHCSVLTNDLSQATGLVLAERLDDDF